MSEEKRVEEEEMRAVVLTSHGGLKSLRVASRAQPTLATDDDGLLIRVKCW